MLERPLRNLGDSGVVHVPISASFLPPIACVENGEAGFASDYTI
jgi:hypothetical protein